LIAERLRVTESYGPADSKSYRRHRFSVGPEVGCLVVRFRYDRGGDLPHNLVTLSLFDPRGFRGAAHRFAPWQEVCLTPGAATPGFVPGALTEGEWWVEVDLHCVIAPGGYELSVDTTDASTVRALAPTAPVLASLRSSMAEPSKGRRWYAGELHLHSTHSDGRWTVEEMAAALPGRGVDFLFLTDHNTITGIDPMRDAVGDAIAVHPGQELTTFRGHALALGPRDWMDWRAGLDGRTANDLARDVRAAGGVMVVAHPDAPPDPICTGCRWTHPDFDPSLVDAVEVWGGLWDGPEERNQGCIDMWHRWLDAGHRLGATGATDAHRHEDWQGPVPLTYAFAADVSLPSILEAIRSGRTYVSSGPGLFIEAREAKGATASLGEALSNPASIEAWCTNVLQGEIRIVVGGSIRGRAAVWGEGRVATTPEAADRWCCAELWNGRVLLAITSPIYFSGPATAS
jgi:hypothetical protein